MGTVNVFLGPSATSQNSADYSLNGWDKDGGALTLTSWSWTETGNGGYVLSHANLIPGCSYWLRKTSGGTPWVQGEIGANVIADIQSGLATAAQVSAIGSGTGAALNFEAAEDNAAGAIIGGTTKVGTQTLTFASTTADNAVYHDIAHSGNAIDWVYGFSVGGGRNASKVTFNGQYVVAAPVAGKAISVYAWNFTGTPAWQLMKTIPGQATGGTDVTVDIALLSAHTGTGADAGKVYIRFAAGTDAVTLKVDQLLLQAQNLGQTIGYANGSIWIEADGGNTGTTPYVDGTGDNPCTYAAAKTLSTALGIKRFTVEPGTTITLNAALTGAVMTGRSYGLALGGQNISSSYFEGVESLSGIGTTATGEAIFVDCHVGTVTLGEFDFVRCHLHGTVTLNTASKYYRMHNCTGIENAVIEFGAATQTLALSEMSGAITITGMTTGDTLLVDGNGVLTLGATCDGGTVHISGNIELTNSGSGQTITYGATTVSSGMVTLADGAHGGPNAEIQLGGINVGDQLDVTVSSAANAATAASALLMERGIAPENWDGSQTTPVAITFSGTGSGEVCFCEWSTANGSGASLFYYDIGTGAITLDGTFDNGPWAASGILALDSSSTPVITAPGTLTLSVKDANGLTRTYSWTLSTIATWDETVLLLKDGTAHIVATTTPFAGKGSLVQPTASVDAATIAAAVTADMDANSTQLAAIVEDTAEIGVAGAGLTAIVPDLSSVTALLGTPADTDLATDIANLATTLGTPADTDLATDIANIGTGGASVADMIAGGIAKEATVLGQFHVTQGIIQAPSVSDNSTLTVVRGDTRTITFTLGSAWNLTSKKLWFTYSTTKGGTAVGAAECTVTDAANGIATYTPAATFFATAGRYWYDVVRTATDGTGQETAFIGPLVIKQDVKA